MVSRGNGPAESQDPDLDASTLHALEACYRLLEEKQDRALCLQLYPELSEEIRKHLATHQVLLALSPSEPDPLAFASGRRRLLSSLSQQRSTRSPALSRRLSGATLAGWLVALSMFSAAAVMGASASTEVPGPVDAVLNGLHIPHTGSDDQSQDPAAAATTPVVHAVPEVPAGVAASPVGR